MSHLIPSVLSQKQAHFYLPVTNKEREAEGRPGDLPEGQVGAIPEFNKVADASSPAAAQRPTSLSRSQRTRVRQLWTRWEEAFLGSQTTFRSIPAGGCPFSAYEAFVTEVRWYLTAKYLEELSRLKLSHRCSLQTGKHSQFADFVVTLTVGNMRANIFEKWTFSVR